MSGQDEVITIGLASAVLALASSAQLDGAAVNQFAYALGFSGVGSAAGALSSAWQSKDLSSTQMRRLFKINMLCGIPFGIGGGYALHNAAGYVPLYACIIAASAFSGWAGVKILGVWITKFINKMNDDKSDKRP